MNQDLNPLEVPADKEDKKTADEDLSFNESYHNIGRESDIFNTSMRDENMISNSDAVNPPVNNKQKALIDLEEEKEGGDS